MSHHLDEVAHDLECASAAYAILIERAENKGNREEARAMRREFEQYRASALSPAGLNTP
jgi:hypothetical protein